VVVNMFHTANAESKLEASIRYSLERVLLIASRACVFAPI